MNWPAMTGVDLAGVMEYNLGRTWSTSRGGHCEAPVPMMARVVTVLLAALLRVPSADCRPLAGKHRPECIHATGLVPMRIGQLVIAMFGYDGGSQRRELENAIELSTTTKVSWTVFSRRGPQYFAFEHLLERVPWTPVLATHLGRFGLDATPDVVVRVHPVIVASLLAGRFQRIDLAVVQALTGSDLLLALNVLCQLPTTRLAAGAEAIFALTGPKPDIERWQIGLRTQSRIEVFRSVQAACTRIKGLQNAFVFDARLIPPSDGYASKRAAVTVRRRKGRAQQ